MVWVGGIAAAQVFLPDTVSKAVVFVAVLVGVGMIAMFVALTEAGCAGALAGVVLLAVLLATLPSAVTHQVLASGGRTGWCETVRSTDIEVGFGDGTMPLKESEVICAGRRMTVPYQALEEPGAVLRYHPGGRVPPVTEAEWRGLGTEWWVAVIDLVLCLALALFLTARATGYRLPVRRSGDRGGPGPGRH
ncbi:hypothetical protein [Actinocorallia aurantiaca]|uniref:hypothetical protein n=1 Tax=Actinocorallia aurantiaca TaxID=46204 RepID=UPI0031DD16D4